MPSVSDDKKRTAMDRRRKRFAHFKVRIITTPSQQISSTSSKIVRIISVRSFVRSNYFSNIT